MKITTRVFGDIEIDEDKIIHFEDGIIGFPECKNFALIFDEERDSERSVKWLQSVDEPVFALPVLDPLVVKEDYSPEVDDDVLKPLGDLSSENTFVLVTVTVPKKIEELSVNLKAPIIINTDKRKACQLILEGSQPVKYAIYELLKEKKAGE